MKRNNPIVYPIQELKKRVAFAGLYIHKFHTRKNTKSTHKYIII
jgi:hypothetical protein